MGGKRPTEMLIDGLRGKRKGFAVYSAARREDLRRSWRNRPRGEFPRSGLEKIFQGERNAKARP